MKLKKLLKTNVSKICRLYDEIDKIAKDTWFAWGYFEDESGKKEKVSLPNKFGKHGFNTKEEAKEAINFFKKEIWK